jgi:hypothetical protein
MHFDRILSVEYNRFYGNEAIINLIVKYSDGSEPMN